MHRGVHIVKELNTSNPIDSNDCCFQKKNMSSNGKVEATYTYVAEGTAAAVVVEDYGFRAVASRSTQQYRG